MTTNSGGTSNPGSNGSDNESSDSQGNDSVSQDGSSSNLLELPPELLVQILGNLDSTSLMTVRLVSKTLYAVVYQLKFRLRLVSRHYSFFNIEGAKAQLENLQNRETLSMARPPNNGTRRNLKLKQVIEQLPTAWMLLASEVELLVDNDRDDGETNGILDVLHARLLRTRLQEQPAVKLHLLCPGRYDLPISFFTNKANANIADLQQQLELATLQLSYDFYREFNEATKRVFDYFHGTEAVTELTLSHVETTRAGEDQLKFIYGRTEDGTERFPNLAALCIIRGLVPTFFNEPDWTILARFRKLAALELYGAWPIVLIVPPWQTTEKLAAMRSLSLANVRLPQDSSFLAAMTGLQRLEVQHVPLARETELNNTIDQVRLAIRNQLLPNLQHVILDGPIGEQACRGFLKSFLEAIGENNCPKLEQVEFLRMPLAGQSPADELRRVLGGLSDNSLEQTKFSLSLPFYLQIFNVSMAKLINEILSLATETQRTGLKQLKLAVRFIEPQPDWQQIVATFNSSQAMFSAEARANPKANATQIPGVFLRISFMDGPDLLIAKRAEAAMELPWMLPQPPEAAEAIEAASQN